MDHLDNGRATDLADATITARNRLNSLQRHRGPHHPDSEAARRDLRAAKAEAVIAQLVAAAPPLTAEQRMKIAAILLCPAAQAGAAA